MTELLLEGIQVLDLSQYLPGPYAGQILADSHSDPTDPDSMNVATDTHSDAADSDSFDILAGSNTDAADSQSMNRFVRSDAEDSCSDTSDPLRARHWNSESQSVDDAAILAVGLPHRDVYAVDLLHSPVAEIDSKAGDAA